MTVATGRADGRFYPGPQKFIAYLGLVIPCLECRLEFVLMISILEYELETEKLRQFQPQLLFFTRHDTFL